MKIHYVTKDDFGKCAFCYAQMILTYTGTTPYGNILTALICPKCFSTRYYCTNKFDPVFKILEEISDSFMQVWSKKKGVERNAVV